MAISDKTNDYSYIQKFYNLNYTCYNCTGIKKKSVVIQNMTGCSLFCPMNTIFESLEVGDTFNNSIYPSPDFIVDIQEKSMLVNSSITKKTFQNINISSFSRSESNNILNLFQNYSFSFPDNLIWCTIFLQNEPSIYLLLIILILWMASISAYAFDYKTGFQCLFFLSFLHVLLELPLNIVSIKGIIFELFNYSNKKIPAK